MLDQRDVGLLLRVLNATELLGHGEKVSGHLARVHQQHRPADIRQAVSREDVNKTPWCWRWVEQWRRVSKYGFRSDSVTYEAEGAK